MSDWSAHDPKQFSEGGFTRDEFDRYRSLCSAALISSRSWTIDGSMMHVVSVSDGRVEWSGSRMETSAQRMARDKAYRVGLGYPMMDSEFKIEVVWEGGG